MVVSDIASDPLWAPYAEIAARFALRACWSEPIFSRTGEVLGSFAMYYGAVHSPSVRELEAGGVAARLAAIAVDRARADVALRRNEERLNRALEAAKMGTWEWDLRSGRVTWSDGVELLFGVERGTFDGTFEAYTQLLPEDERPRVRAAIEASLQDGAQDYLVDHRVQWPDGSLHFLEGKGRVYRDEQERRSKWWAPWPTFRTANAARPRSAGAKNNFDNRSRWRPSGGWRVASRTTSTTC